MKQIFEISGKIIDLSIPMDIPMKDYSIMYITVEIDNENAKFNNEKKGYYTFTHFRFNGRKYERISIGDNINCQLRRSSNIWYSNGNWNIKKEFKIIEGERIEVGNHPIILESYTSVGLIYKNNVHKKKKEKENSIYEEKPFYNDNLKNIDTVDVNEIEDELPF